MLRALVTLVYGLIITGGGVAGYALAGSVPSIISGGLLGMVAVVGAVLMMLGNPYGQVLAIISAILVGLFFAFQLARAIISGGPAGRAAGILFLSLVELAVIFFVRTPSGQ